MIQKLSFCSFILLALFFLTHCKQATKNELTQADIKYLQSIADRDRELVLGKQWDTLTAQYSKDAVRLPPNGGPVRGRDSIRQWFNYLPPIKDFHFKMKDLKGDGMYAYMIADFDITLSPPSFRDFSDTGKTLVVFRKEPDGKWLRVADAWSSNLAAGK